MTLAVLRRSNLVAEQPGVGVPTVVLQSGADGVGGPSAVEDRDKVHRAV
jgi:hypothetical protein